MLLLISVTFTGWRQVFNWIIHSTNLFKHWFTEVIFWKLPFMQCEWKHPAKIFNLKVHRVISYCDSESLKRVVFKMNPKQFHVDFKTPKINLSLPIIRGSLRAELLLLCYLYAVYMLWMIVVTSFRPILLIRAKNTKQMPIWFSLIICAFM